MQIHTGKAAERGALELPKEVGGFRIVIIYEF